MNDYWYVTSITYDGKKYYYLTRKPNKHEHVEFGPEHYDVCRSFKRDKESQ